ncbi:MAG: hypothetical protein KME23_22260 [Goleter apudmare HA4340-LM2]|nr:hypothetical protein [Goleter apudmare HA4340-LM2]
MVLPANLLLKGIENSDKTFISVQDGKTCTLGKQATGRSLKAKIESSTPANITAWFLLCNPANLQLQTNAPARKNYILNKIYTHR